MGSPSFGLMPGNNAPPPPSGPWNPTGTNSGVSLGGTTFPSYPMFGGMSSGTVSPTANMPVSGNGIQSLSSGFGSLGPNNWGQDFYNMLGKAYGKGTGQLLGNILENGLFNPQVAQALIDAMQPNINRGVASLQNSFGAEGSRFGSAAALGIGDFLSQANLNEQQTMAQMFLSDQQMQLQLLEGVLPTIHGERANSGGLWEDILGGLEIAGGIAAAPFSGGASLALVGSGIGTLSKGLDNSGGSGGGGFNPGMTQMPTFGNTGMFGNSQSWNTSGGQWDNLQQWNLDSSAGETLGGNTGDGSLLFGGLNF